MGKTLNSLCKKIGIRKVTIDNFCNVFNISLDDIYNDNLHIWSSYLKDDFVKFILKYDDFIRKFEDDYYSDKTPEIISKTISRDVLEVIEYLQKNYPQYFVDGKFTPMERYTLRYVSSFKIDLDLGKKYDMFVFPAGKKQTKKNESVKNFNFGIDTIGYTDIVESILEQLEPIINPQDIKDWGLANPGGILLFGPPGCGKTFWAKNISKLISYQFEEIPRSIFGSSFVDGAMLNLKKKLAEYDEKPNTVIFFDEFDSVASTRSNHSSGNNENSKVVNTLLQEIPKLIQKRILIIAATNFIEQLDSAAIRPGRFDLKIPVFPPNMNEKTKLIVFNLSKGLNKDSLLLKILEYNNAINEKFWIEVSSKMTLFSNSMVIDFTQVLKRKIKLKYKETQTTEIAISNELINNVLEETSAKLTSKEAEMFAQFYNEVKSLGSGFYQERLDYLYMDLSNYFKKENDPPTPIGYRQPKIDK